MSGGGTTSTAASGPPQQYLDAFSRVNQQAQNVAATPYQPYPGQAVAQFSPDQAGAIGSIEGLTANGGVQQPYLASAEQSFQNAQQPLLTPNLNNLYGQVANGLSQSNIDQFENPWTQQVVNATQAEFNNQNQQQQQQIAGNAASRGAYGGDREAVAQGIAAGQQQLAQAPVIGNLESQGYLTGLQGAEKQAALRAGAAQQQLGAGEAQASLASQAGFGQGNLGSEALSLGLQGAAGQLQAGTLEQQMAQENLNIPMEQYLAAQAYPFQTTGWLANIGEGLGGASGGTSSTTQPAPSGVSQGVGLAAGAAGLIGAANNAGAFYNTAGSIAPIEEAVAAQGGRITKPHSLSEFKPYMQTADSFDGVGLRRAAGGDIPDASMSVVPGFGLGASPVNTTNPTSIVPGGNGLGATPAHHGTADILKNYGSTTSSSQDQSGQDAAALLTVAKIAATLLANRGGKVPHYESGGSTHSDSSDSDSSQQMPWYAPLLQESLERQMADSLSSSSMASGGMIPHFDMGGVASPWWERAEERQAVDRHGLLASPVAGRTDQLAVSPASGSYVVPADVVSGLGEGNTLAGANVVQRMLETGPHGTRMPRGPGREMGPPHPPPAYREGQSGMASGGEVAHLATGGMSPAVTSYMAGNTPTAAQSADVATHTPWVGHTGIPALDNYLVSTQAGASYARPSVYVPPPPTQATVPLAIMPDQPPVPLSY